MSGLFAGTSLERPVTCERCGRVLAECKCPRGASGRIVLPGAQASPKSQAPRVRREKRRGKVVTVIAQLDPKATDLQAMLKEFKTRFGAGGTVSEGEIELQGDHREKVVEELIKRGYAAKAAGG